MRIPSHVVVFSKPPVPGLVKTRLIPAIGDTAAAQLHLQLLRQNLCVVQRTDYPASLWIAGAIAHPALLDASHDFGMALRVQEGGDLGARMKHAMQTVLTYSHTAIIIGSDCPVLETTHFRQVVCKLKGDAEVGVIPAEDGGYVLIAASIAELARRKVVLDALFDDITWSTDKVMEQTRERLRQVNATWFELPALWDVDNPEDLLRLESQTDLSDCPAT
jgi:uncharacterized protein